MLRKQLHCGTCRWSVVCTPPAMVGWLQSIGMLRRETKPEPEFVAELFKTSAHRMSCPKCKTSGLVALDPLPEEEDDEAWGMALRCEACQSLIPAERVAALPEIRLCVACQGREERGQPVGEQQYCQHCGSLVEVRLSRRAGISRYELACGSCGRSQ